MKNILCYDTIKRKQTLRKWENQQVLTIQKTEVISNLYLSNVIEEKLEILKDDGEKWQIKVKPYEILTLGAEKC